MKIISLLLVSVMLFSFCVNSFAELVEISVEITEVNNNKALELGVKWPDTVEAGELAVESGKTPSLLPEVPTIIGSGQWSRYTVFSSALKFLQEKGAAQILSKPKLVTKSGTTAKFLVGGEFPVVATGTTASSIEWKEYGIKTEVLPKVDGDYIDLVLTTEVSRLDWANKVQGYPAVATRKATSSVRIKSGETIALAGLLETVKEEHKTGIPLLSDIPLLGVLFSRKSTIENKTNILIFVTPKLVQ